MNTIKAIVLFSLLVAPLAACADLPTVYESKPIEAWVVDADTGQPIEGAVVLAQWRMSLKGERLQGDDYSPKIMETVTDSAGRFSFPGWGPEPVCCGYLDWNDPQIFIFKPGYSWIIHSDTPVAVVEDPRVRNPFWNGTKFQLTAYKGSYQGDEGKKYFEEFGRFDDVFNFGFLTQPEYPCGWTKVPHFMSGLLNQINMFRRHGYHDGDSIIKHLIEQDSSVVKDDHCVSPKEYFQGLRQ